MATIYLIAAGFFIICPIIWVLLKWAPWSAPLSAIAGFFIFVLGAYLGSGRMMAFGAGLFGFSALVFALGGGLAGR